MVKIWLLLRASICHKQDFPIKHPLLEILKKNAKTPFFLMPSVGHYSGSHPKFFSGLFTFKILLLMI